MTPKEFFDNVRTVAQAMTPTIELEQAMEREAQRGVHKASFDAIVVWIKDGDYDRAMAGCLYQMIREGSLGELEMNYRILDAIKETFRIMEVTK